MPTENQMNAAQFNMYCRNAILLNATPRLQQIATYTGTTAAKTTYDTQPKLTGLTTGFYVEVVHVIANAASGSSALTLTQFGAANAVNRVELIDTSNYQRIATSGLHLCQVNSQRAARPFGCVTPVSNSALGFGENISVISASATIATGASGTVKMVYWVPCAYSAENLMGSILTQVNATSMNLQVKLPTDAQMCVGSTSDPTFAIYQGAGTVVTTSTTTIKVSQRYFDQIPVENGMPLVPEGDLGINYELKDYSQGGLVVNMPNFVNYTAQRQFLSRMIVFNNQANGVYPAHGSDVTKIGTVQANSTELIMASPEIFAILTRQLMDCDTPKGVYLFNSREKPINIENVGHVQNVIVPNLVNAGSYLYVGEEMLSNNRAFRSAGGLAL